MGFEFDSESELRLREICPIFAGKVRRVGQRMQQEHQIELRVVQGLRSWAMQHEIWQQGRDAMGNVVDKSKVVTNAPPGHSWHEFGLAVDVCPFLDNKPEWDIKNPAWDLIQKIGTEERLFSGACFHNPDHPHLQLTGNFPVSPNDEVRQIFRDGGMGALWTESGI